MLLGLDWLSRSSIAGSAFVYQVSSGKDFNSRELLATCAVGGVAGAVSGVLGIPTVNPVVSVSGNILTSGVAWVSDYALRHPSMEM
jgi:hypothetical protein